MKPHSPEAVTYQYPDPEDATHGLRFSWAGEDNDNDYVPVALRQTLSASWHNVEAEHGDDTLMSPGGTSSYGDDSSTDQEDEAAVEAHGGTVAHL